MTNNSSDFRSNKVLSLSIRNKEQSITFEYIIRSASVSTSVEPLEVVDFWQGNRMAIIEKFFSEFKIQSDTKVTVVWEQAEI